MIQLVFCCTFVGVDQVDEDQERDVEVHLREERSPTGFTSRRGQTGVQLRSTWDKLQEELLIGLNLI